MVARSGWEHLRDLPRADRPRRFRRGLEASGDLAWRHACWCWGRPSRGWSATIAVVLCLFAAPLLLNEAGRSPTQRLVFLGLGIVLVVGLLVANDRTIGRFAADRTAP
jgi:hypothetical protein